MRTKEEILEANRKWKAANKERVKLYNQEYRKTNKERITIQMKEWHILHPDYGPRKGQEWRIKNKEEYKKYRRDDYKIKQEAIAGKPMPNECEICKRPRGNKVLYLDHNHNTGNFRGWICLKCNSALGMVEDNVNTLTNMIQYLQQKQ